MWRFLNYGAVILAVLVGVIVMHLKQQVKEQKEELQIIADDIRKDRETIRVLEAEWALLSSPTLLQDRSYRFLALMPVVPGQILDDPNAIPMRKRGVDADADDGVLLPVSKPRNRPRNRSRLQLTRADGGNKKQANVTKASARENKKKDQFLSKAMRKRLEEKIQSSEEAAL